eukprot:445326_1
MGACCASEQQPGQKVLTSKEIDTLITNQTNTIQNNEKNIYGSDATKAESSPLKVTNEAHPIEDNQSDSHQLPQKTNNNETKNDENEDIAYIRRLLSIESEEENSDDNPEKYIVNKFILIDGYIRRLRDKEIISFVPSEIIKVVCLFHGGFPTLVIGNNETYRLPSDYLHRFTCITIEPGGVLTVTPWSPRERKGGKLMIACLGTLLLRKGALITLDGKGCKGAGRKKKGESYNYLGGGGGAGSGMYLGGGGGGYGCSGGSFQRQNGNGGKAYGDKKITEMMLGSGGGGWNCGGNGGGALKIRCNRFECDGVISANGQNGQKGQFGLTGGGGGSGGCIFIECRTFKLKKDGIIRANGGKGADGYCGNGGYGRIRIKTSSNISAITKKQIYPDPYTLHS